MLGAAGLVLTSAGLAGAEAPTSPGNSEAAIPEHAAAASARHTDADPAEQDPAVTEDNDGNDDNTPNNVVDDDDNAHPSGKDRSVENGGSENQGNAQSDPDDDGRGPDRSPEGNEGADKPDGPGGIDKADQDSNNGCGNDDDFEDDNEGLCLGPDAAPGQQDDEQQVSGDEVCPGTDVVITDDADVDMDGVVDLCEQGTNGSDGSETPVEVDNGEQLAPPAVMDEEEVRQPSPVTAVEGDVVVRTSGAPAGPSAPMITPITPTTPAVQAVAATRSPQVLGSQVTRSPAALAATGDATTNLVPFGLGLVLLGFAVQRNSKRLSAGRVR
jgi:hypothetical protein